MVPQRWALLRFMKNQKFSAIYVVSGIWCGYKCEDKPAI